MQLPVRCSRRIFLAVCVILFVGCTVQGNTERLFSLQYSFCARQCGLRRQPPNLKENIAIDLLGGMRSA